MSLPEETLTELHSEVKLIALSANIKPLWMWLAVTNALAYNRAVLIITLKGFIVPTPGDD
jgi:hypothetical protein